MLGSDYFDMGEGFNISTTQDLFSRVGLDYQLLKLENDAGEANKKQRDS